MDLSAIAAPRVANPADLSEWLALARERDVPHVEAEEVGRCWPGELMAHMCEESMPQRNYAAMMGRLGRIDLEGSMLRWNLCAPIRLKEEIAETGRASAEAARGIDPAGDLRLASIIEDQSPMQVMILYRRPWVEPERHEGFPVEFRAFVEGRRVIGASNYYPQVSLPKKYRRIGERCMRMTERIADARPHDGFTADWILTAEGEMLLLECGPMHAEGGAGSHPCCFDPGEVEGVRLSK